jgi:proteic killer suppression protein
MAINSFSDSNTKHFFESGKIAKGIGWSAVISVARRKLDMLHYAAKLEDLRSPPGNRLERLLGELAGYHSIRINDQWRIVFRWKESGPEEVRICDYHT